MEIKKLKIVFMGTPEFAVASLDILVQNKYEIVGVITAPDKPAGRGQKLQESAVKEYALKNGLRILQPTNLKDEGFLKELKELKADLQIVVAFRMLPEVVWNMPTLGTYNLHGSLLPKYRGAAPINWCIINGDKESGVTTFKLTHQIDTGNMLYQDKIQITDNMTAGELHDALMIIGARLILKTVNAIQESVNTNTPLKYIQQDDSQATHAPKIFKETCKIDWKQPIQQVYNLIRGLSPYPAAYTEFKDANGQILSFKIFKAEIISTDNAIACGALETDNRSYIYVNGTHGKLSIHELQLQGKKRMQVKEFLNGYRFADKTILE